MDLVLDHGRSILRHQEHNSAKEESLDVCQRNVENPFSPNLNPKIGGSLIVRAVVREDQEPGIREEVGQFQSREY
jgi:hypothetical protein